ncbi:MAG: hypothetical protein HYX53_13230 [Chloroflexi bacterium]|nr:hypothetical protein [Chloroflexota bacterium]
MVAAHLAHIERVDPALHAVVAVRAEGALADARDAAGLWLPPPLAITANAPAP